MSVEIRKIEKKDFQEISSLFEGQEWNSEENLLWLFRDPSNVTNFNAFVAYEKDDTLVGVIAYFLSKYSEKGKEIIAVIPMSWMLRKGYKGMAGVMLFKRASELGDISIAPGGEEHSIKLYPMFNYKYVTKAYHFYKVLKPLKYFGILKRSSFIKKVGMFLYLAPSYLKRSSSHTSQVAVQFTPYNEQNFIEDKNDHFFCRSMTKHYVDWFLSGTRSKNYAFSVSVNNESIGLCLLSKKKVENTFKGRIVHLPNLADKPAILSEVINRSVQFLKKEGCCFVSGIGLNSSVCEMFKENRFINLNNHEEVIYVKDKNNKLEKFNLLDWNFQFSEGDIGFINY